MSDHPALITFSEGWALSAESSPDGMPIYNEAVIIHIERPPLLSLQRAATKEDFADHPAEYEAFQAVRKARRNVGDDGYPLVYWPAVSAAELQMLAVRNIVTVEQLANLANNRELPGQLADLALRAERMLDMQKNFGSFEKLLAESNAERDEMISQNKELKSSLSAAQALVETLKLKVA
jgi:hypothetical protein